MSDPYIDSLMSGLASSLESEMEHVGDEIVDDVQELIKIDVVWANDIYGTEVIERSKIGEPPRRETGRLQRSIIWEIFHDAPDQTLLEVSANTPYASNLQRGLNRPYMSTAALRWDAKLEPRLAAWAASTTGNKTP